jgi:hypothetical protein
VQTVQQTGVVRSWVGRCNALTPKPRSESVAPTVTAGENLLVASLPRADARACGQGQVPGSNIIKNEDRIFV